MTRYMFGIFLPLQSFRRMIPVLSVLCVLTLGIGVFWSVQSLLGNYMEGLFNMVTVTKEEIAIIKNPDREFMTEEERDEEFFSGKELNLRERTALSRSVFNELAAQVHETDSQLKIEGIYKVPEADMVMNYQNVEIHCKPVLIALEIQKEARILPILDLLSDQEVEEFNTSGDTIPMLASHGIFPDLQQGETISLTYSGQTSNFRLVSELKQSEFFSVPTVIIPAQAYEKLTGISNFDMAAIRTPYQDSQHIQSLLEEKLGQRFIVTHWSDILDILSGVFNSVNAIITAIISSLFFITFLFSAATFDIIIKKRKQHLALFLAMGMPPVKIRNCLLCISFGMAFLGILAGWGLANLFLQIVPYTPLDAMFSLMYIDNFSFRYDTQTFLLVFVIAFVTTTLSAWLASRRIYQIDPLEDLKK